MQQISGVAQHVLYNFSFIWAALIKIKRLLFIGRVQQKIPLVKKKNTICRKINPLLHKNNYKRFQNLLK